MTTKITRRVMLGAVPALAVGAPLPANPFKADSDRMKVVAAAISKIALTPQQRAEIERDMVGPDERLIALIAERSDVFDYIGTLPDYVPGNGTAVEAENNKWESRLSELDEAIETWPAATWADVMAKVRHTVRWIDIPAMVDEERMLRHLVKDILRLEGVACGWMLAGEDAA